MSVNTDAGSPMKGIGQTHLSNHGGKLIYSPNTHMFQPADIARSPLIG